VRGTRAVAFFSALLPLAASARAQAEYRVYEDHPRIFLEPERLVRLRRDVDRQSLRWQALHEMIQTGAAFEEQPLVDALLYQTEGDARAGRRAVQWCLASAPDGVGSSAELRMLALAYDWCHDLFDPADKSAVGGAMASAIEDVVPRANLGPGLIRAAILGSIALAGDWDGSEAALGALLETHWEADIRPGLEDGRIADDAGAMIAALEAGLAVRHNLDRDLLKPGFAALRALARCRLLSYYPADIETAEGRMRRPSRFGPDEAAARLQAPLDRIVEMLTVAYEANLREFQFVQGWIRDEAYLPRSTLLAPYEFLWVNPYLPGLTAESSPLIAHDSVRGRLFGRSTWEWPTTWIGYSEGRLEILAGGELSTTESMGGLSPVFFEEAVVVPLRPPGRVVLSWEPSRDKAPESVTVYLIGLAEGETYGLRIAGREPRLIRAGPGGIAIVRSDPGVPRRDRIDFRRRVRLDLQPTLKPTRPGRPPPSLTR